MGGLNSSCSESKNPEERVHMELQQNKQKTYCEQDGNRDESFSRAIRAIDLVVRSEAWRFMATSTTSTASDSVTCKQEKNIADKESCIIYSKLKFNNFLQQKQMIMVNDIFFNILC